ncbi:MAG: hypothetical protein M1813_002244 [Trichoglossum hirsutum]|nr:MAG: hypothetical protein M1813_002244 [Trichoglossum hirsutum]
MSGDVYSESLGTQDNYQAWHEFARIRSERPMSADLPQDGLKRGQMPHPGIKWRAVYQSDYTYLPVLNQRLVIQDGVENENLDADF